MRTLIFTLLIFTSLTRGDSWPMLAHDPARTAATTDEIRPPFERKWYRLFPDQGLMAGVQPVIADGKVFIGTLRGIVHAMDEQSGKDLWTYRAGGPCLHACAIDDNKVFFGSADGWIYALDTKDGSQAWKVQTGAAIWNSPVIFNGLLIIGGRDNFLWAIDIQSGDVKWIGETGGPILSSPAIDPKSKRVYVGCEDMHAYAFDLATGAQIWRGDKLPGVSFRGYHPTIAPDGSIMITTTPCAGGDAIQQIMLDMVKEIFGDFASWRHKKNENDILRKKNFDLMERPETYQKQLDYIRRRLTDEPAYQTFFILDPQTGKQKFIAPIVYAESMNGPASPPLVTPAGKVIVKYNALLRSRYEHYSPFLNVGYLDTTTGNITPVMDQTRTYGWHDSLLLVHDEQSQLSLAGNILINTHQDNVNAMDLTTLRGFDQPFAWNVHEVKPGVAASIWATHLSGEEIPVGWEWLARGTAVYGGGSAIDVPVSISGDSFYYLPTHEINSGCAIIAYRMQKDGTASQRRPEPSRKITEADWKKIQQAKWDWDTLATPRLKDTLGRSGTPARLEKSVEVKIPDTDLDRIIWDVNPPSDVKDKILEAQVEELINTNWRPALFPAAKAPSEAYRLLTDPMETILTLSLAYPHLSDNLQKRVKSRVAELLQKKSYPPTEGQIRTAYDPAPEKMMRILEDAKRNDTGKTYILYLWATVAGEKGDKYIKKGTYPLFDTPASPTVPDIDCGNSRLSGLIAACRVAKHFNDDTTLQKLLTTTRDAMRARVKYELDHPEDGVILPLGSRSIFSRWHFLTPEVATLIRTFAPGITEHLMDVYVDYHRPTWYLAWNVELLWRNEAPFGFPTTSLDILAAKSMILREKGMEKYLDLPWFKGDEYQIQKRAMLLNLQQN